MWGLSTEECPSFIFQKHQKCLPAQLQCYFRLLFSMVFVTHPPTPTPHPPTNTQTNSLHIHPAPSAQPSTHSHRRSSKLRWDRHVWNTSKHNWSPTNLFCASAMRNPCAPRGISPAATLIFGARAKEMLRG